MKVGAVCPTSLSFFQDRAELFLPAAAPSYDESTQGEHAFSNSSRDSRRNVRQGSEMVRKNNQWLSLGPDDFTPENRRAKALANYGAFASEYLSPTLRQTWPRE